MSAKANARPDWILNARKTAEWLGIAKSTFSERGYEPIERSANQAFYDVRSILRAEAVSCIHEASGGETIDHELEKAMLTKSRRVAQDLDNYERTGQLAPVEVFASAFEEFTGAVAQTLEGLPGDVRRADPTISARSLEVIEVKVAEFRNLAADKCERLSQSVTGL